MLANVFLVSYTDDAPSQWMDEEQWVRAGDFKEQNHHATRKRIPTIILIRVRDIGIQTRRSTKYLGVTLGNKINYWDHICKACDSAVEVPFLSPG